MAVLNATIQSVRNVEPVFGGHRCVSVDFELTDAQMSELFETLWDKATAATKEGMRAYVAPPAGPEPHPADVEGTLNYLRATQ